MRRRLLIRLVAGLLLTALAGAPVAAGGWAEAKMDGIGGSGGDSGGGGITEGTEQRVDFRLLAHGFNPVDWGTAMLVATNRDTGDAVRVPAENLGKGLWTATLTFPAEGSWQLSVEHSEVLTSNLPIVEVAGAPALGTGVAQALTVALVAAMALAGVALLVISGRRLRRSRPAGREAEVEPKLARA